MFRTRVKQDPMQHADVSEANFHHILFIHYLNLYLLTYKHK